MALASAAGDLEIIISPLKNSTIDRRNQWEDFNTLNLLMLSLVSTRVSEILDDGIFIF